MKSTPVADPAPDFEAGLSRRWRPALMAFFVRRTRDRSEAEDLTQEVFLRLLSHDASATVSDGYIFRTAQNLLVDRARKGIVRDRYREALKYDPDDGQDVLDPGRVAEGRQELSLILAGLNELPERTRTIFLLFKVENLSQLAIAQTFDISESAVKQQVAKALAHLIKKQKSQ